MANGLLDSFQPQTIGYGNTLLEDPVQYDLSGFEAIGQTVGDMAKGVLQSAKLPGRALRGEMGPPSLLNPEFVEGATQFGVDFGMFPALGTAAIAAPSANTLMMGSGGGKIRAYHGSPYSFDKFRTSQIGTGEGNQAFGEGLYFADVEKTGKSYRDEGVWRKAEEGKTPILYKDKPFRFLDDVPSAEDPEYQAVSSIVDIMRRRKVSPEEAKKLKIESLERDIKRYQSAGSDDSDVGFIDIGDGQSLEGLLSESLESSLRRLREINPSDIKVDKGSMYEVQIDARLDELIDYDKPLGEQSPEVKAIFDKATDNLNVDDAMNLGFDPFEMTGKNIEEQAIQKAKASLLNPENSVESFLNTMASVRGSSGAGEQMLREQGAKGIKYYDADARGTAGGNLVDTFKDEQGFRAKVAVDGRTGYFGNRGRIVTTSPPFKTEKEALDWADEATKRATRNYVIFDEDLIEIIKKYGFVPPALLGVEGLLSDEQQMTGDEMLRAGII